MPNMLEAYLGEIKSDNDLRVASAPMGFIYEVFQSAMRDDDSNIFFVLRRTHNVLTSADNVRPRKNSFPISGR